MDDVTFEHEVLGRLAAAAGYPPTPPMRARVLAAIADQPVAMRPARRARWALPALAAAAAVLVAGAGVLAVPSSRSAVAGFFGITGSKVEVLPTPAPGVTPTPFPTPAGIESFATPSSFDDAAAAAGFAPALPPAQGQPSATYVVDYSEHKAIVLQYDRYDLWESRGAGFFLKGVPPELVVRDFEINGRPATLIRGGQHIVRYVDADGREAAASVRTVRRTTLIWNGAMTFYRMETDLSEDEAVRVAESLP